MASTSVNFPASPLLLPPPMTFPSVISLLEFSTLPPHFLLLQTPPPSPHHSRPFTVPYSLPTLHPSYPLKPSSGHGGTQKAATFLKTNLPHFTTIFSPVNYHMPVIPLLRFRLSLTTGFSLTFLPSSLLPSLLLFSPFLFFPISLPNMTYPMRILPHLLHDPSFPLPVTTWAKCRVAAPKIWAHQGTIKSADGTPCRTSHSLDLALRATRAFWQDSPTPYHPSWTPLLTSYASANTPFPPTPPPAYDEFYHAVISSPDSAPGADGIPFSAYRVSPAVSAEALNSHFSDILSQRATPPVQTLVFIPKADVGDYADNYRPLGLPNSSDRLIDRAAYGAFTLSLLGYLHPAQALLNLFREPQANYLEVQNFLDNTSDRYAVLLSDLAKAFERVNPHWIMHVLFARKAPYWILIYCRHILFGRKVLHKVGSFFRPPLPLNTGVDMGRAFSVLLFCVAMDPWYHHVNAIPRVLVNKGYMDDNATGGQGLSWLLPTQNLINTFHEAGFQVLTHACYLVEPIFHTTATPYIETSSPVTQGYPSLRAAFQHSISAPFVRLRSGSLSITVPTGWISCQDVFNIPSYPHLTSMLHTTQCKCKCKTYLIPNYQLSDQDLLYLDSTPFGAKIISPSATMLGLYLHSPLSSIFRHIHPSPSPPSPPPPPPTSPPILPFSEIEANQSQKALRIMERRIRACIPLQLSFKDRTLYLSFYVLSLPHYQHSTLTPSASLIKKYYAFIRTLLCPRHWIQAQHLPGIVSFLKLGILHCPSISLYSSLLGFSIRCFGEPIITWLCSITSHLPPLPRQISQGLSANLSMLRTANSYNPEPFSELFQRHLFQQISPFKLSHIITKLFKQHMRRKLFIVSRNFLLHRYSQVPWHLAPSPHLFDALHRTSLKIIPSFSRLAINTTMEH